MTKPAIAYVAEGKLYTQASTGEPRLVESPFVQNILDRLEKNRQRNDWKSGNMAWQLTGRPANPFGPSANVAELRRVHFAGVAAGPSTNDVLYAIDTDYTCGLFHQELDQGFERRLYHRNQFRALDLARCPLTGMLAFTIRAPDGTAHIATMAAEGRGLKEITQGDAVDEAPSWVPGEKNVLLFQSAGVGRDHRGAFTGLSPYCIQKVDLDGANMKIVVEEDNSDTLLPKQAADGSLYFIRRPYQPMGNAVPTWRHAVDIVLFPFRLLRAIAHFLNFFSLMFSKKPLMTAGGPPQEGPDQRVLMLYGRVIDARKLQRAAANGSAPALVPASWTLIRKMSDETESVMAKSVLAYDLCPSGGFIYSNGSKIFHVTAKGDSTEIGQGKMIERLAVLGE